MRLRRKIEPDPKEPRIIVTVPGGGYKFIAKPQTMSALTETASGPSSIVDPVASPASTHPARDAGHAAPVAGRARVALVVAALFCVAVAGAMLAWRFGPAT